MNKPSTAVLVAVLLLTSGISASWAQTQQPAPTNPARMEAQLSKTIVFIDGQAKWPDKDGKPGERVNFQATGFIVAVPDSRLAKDQAGNDRSFHYLVTNRHVAKAIEKDVNGICTPLQIQTMSLVGNLRDTINGQRIAVVPDALQAHWYFPEDPAIDLAVAPITPSDSLDILSIPLQMFLTSEILAKQQVSAGDKVLTAGLFTGFPGLHEVQPIFREGILAMLPDGPMTTTLCGSGDVYLADVHIIPGNSGSPIFVIPTVPGVSFGGAQNTFGLLGVVSGYMIENEDATLTAATTWKGSVSGNSGISIVVPAQQLRDLLESPELQGIRDAFVASEKKPQP